MNTADDIRRIVASTQKIARIRNGLGARQPPSGKGTIVNQEMQVLTKSIDDRLCVIEGLLGRLTAGIVAVLGHALPEPAPVIEYRNGIGEPDQLGCGRYEDKAALNAHYPFADKVADRILARRVLVEWPERFTPEQAADINSRCDSAAEGFNGRMYRDGKGNTIMDILVLVAHNREEERAELEKLVLARADDRVPPKDGPVFSPGG